ncbi:M23 family metallopeptidase [Microbacterium sp. Be9]|uniref:M23 family metallopeptidase n=1 Tax=Microbacterium sp. Be9 TaxID=2720211 RepID=UPI00326399A7
MRIWPTVAGRRSTPPTPEQWTTPAPTVITATTFAFSTAEASAPATRIKPGGIVVGRGQWVNSGQVIAYAGDTGRSFGCHLHFEVYINGGYTNPVRFMEDRGVYI